MRDGKLLRPRRRPQSSVLVVLSLILLGGLLLLWQHYPRRRVRAMSSSPSPTQPDLHQEPRQPLEEVKEEAAELSTPTPPCVPSVVVGSPNSNSSLLLQQQQQCPNDCSGHGVCNAARAHCRCNEGWAGLACEYDVKKALGKTSAASFEERRREERANIDKSSGGGESLPDSNRLLHREDVAKLVQGVIVPVHRREKDASLVVRQWREQLTQSIAQRYPQLRVVEGYWGQSSASADTVEREIGEGAADHLAEAWNDGLRTLRASSGVDKTGSSPKWILFLSPAVLRFHEETNLELLMTIAFTESVEVIGFSSLYPIRDHEQQWNQHNKNNKNKRNGGEEDVPLPPFPPLVGGAEEYVFHSDCWEMVTDRWVLQHRKPLFGYQRHIGKYAMMCDRSSDSFAVRDDTIRSLTDHGASSLLFNESLGKLSLTDFYLRIQRRNEKVTTDHHREQQALNGLSTQTMLPSTKLSTYVKVATCVECLLLSSHENPLLSDAEVRRKGTSSNERSFFVQRQNERDGTMTIIPPPLRYRSRNHPDFAELHQIEQVVGPHLLDLSLHTAFQQVAHNLPLLEKPFDELVREGRIACTRSGGIYGHSKRGLYSPLCHRYQRQRDFLYLSSLWCDSSRFQSGGAASSSSSKRYAVSVHHGNLFGALRMGSELLWETDGDFDFISFDESHDEMMLRWEALQQYVTQHAGFELKVTYPEKPWYVSYLRDKTDFQLNVRGVKSPMTRGRPPHQHNVTVFYQGLRVFVNGFQNPWVGIRADPGHDYRRNYLAQQGWVLQFTGKSIHCAAETVSKDGAASNRHPACLPKCNDPQFLRDFDRCSVEMQHDDATGGQQQLQDALVLRDPILWV